MSLWPPLIRAYFTFIVVLIGNVRRDCSLYVLFIENLLLPLQGFANVFYLLRPRIQSLKSNPEFYFTAAYLCFHYDEIRQRVTKSVFSQVCRDLEVNRRGDELRALDGHGRNRRL
jgi:hypothetical protein